MYACLGVSRHAGQSNMKNEIDSKYLITIGNGLITFINVILLFLMEPTELFNMAFQYLFQWT